MLPPPYHLKYFLDYEDSFEKNELLLISLFEEITLKSWKKFPKNTAKTSIKFAYEILVFVVYKVLANTGMKLPVKSHFTNR